MTAKFHVASANPDTVAAAIDRCIAALAVNFQKHIDVGTIRVYRETLADQPLWAIEEAALHLRRTGGDFLPTAAKWHEAAAALVAARMRFTRGPTPTWTGYEHEDCHDTGWEEVTHDDGTLWYRPCPCRPTNSTYQRTTRSSRKSDTNRS